MLYKYDADLSDNVTIFIICIYAIYKLQKYKKIYFCIMPTLKKYSASATVSPFKKNISTNSSF